MIVNSDTHALTMVKGDTDALKVELECGEFTAGAVVRMTVRRSLYGGVIFSKEVEPEPGKEAYIYIGPADTKCLRAGSYVYDIEIDLGGGEQTAVPCAEFKLLEEVTR